MNTPKLTSDMTPDQREAALQEWGRQNPKVFARLLPVTTAIPMVICIVLWRLPAGTAEGDGLLATLAGRVSMLGLLGTLFFGALTVAMLAVALFAQPKPQDG